MPWDGIPGANRHFRTAAHRSGDEGVDSAKAFECRTKTGGAKVDDDHAPGRLAEGRYGDHHAGGDHKSVIGRHAGMNSFRYQAIEGNGNSVKGVIEAADRRAALLLLGERGLFPSSLETCSTNGQAAAVALPAQPQAESRTHTSLAGFRIGGRITRKRIKGFTREMSALRGAAIPIPQAVDGLGEEEENPALRR